MWLFTRYGFFSATCAQLKNSRTVDPDNIAVRARVRAHLHLLMARFPDVLTGPVIETCDRDYRWRTVISKVAWACVVSELALETDYDNFKDEAARCIPPAVDDAQYVPMLHDVWQLHHDMQVRVTPLAKRPWGRVNRRTSPL